MTAFKEDICALIGAELEAAEANLVDGDDDENAMWRVFDTEEDDALFSLDNAEDVALDMDVVEVAEDYWEDLDID